MKGKYSFQYIENLTIEDSVLDTKDAFWHSKNITVKNSVVKGDVISIKNPKSGTIVVDSVGEIIWDDPVMPCNGVVKTR